MVSEEPGRVVVSLVGGFSKEDERLGGGEILRHFPFVPDFLEGLPGALHHGAFEYAVLRGFLCVGVADFAMRWDTHELEPGAHREALVEGQPDERAHLSWARVVPNSGDHLRGCGFPEVEALDEGEHVGCACQFLGISVSPLGCVAKEWCITEWWSGSPMPLPWVPWELLYEPCFKDPVGLELLT